MVNPIKTTNYYAQRGMPQPAQENLKSIQGAFLKPGGALQPQARLSPSVSDPQQQALNFIAQKNKLDIKGQPKLGGFVSAGNVMKAPGVVDKNATAKGLLGANFQLTDPFAKGPQQSPWLAQQLEQQQNMQNQQLNQGAQQAATAAASAQAGLARRGGLSSGAAERLAGAAQDQRALGAQDIYGQGAQQRLGMQTQDMQQQRDYLTGLGQQNIQTRLGELARKQDFDLKKYEEDMKAYGARKSAEATLNS